LKSSILDLVYKSTGVVLLSQNLPFFQLKGTYRNICHFLYLCIIMNIEILKSKIHRATITQANLNYIGSISVDEDLMDAANLIEFEKVQVVNINNGERLETYVIKGERGSGVISLNGAAARKASIGDLVIIAGFAQIEFEEAKSFKPSIVFPDSNNKIS
jgi:aspartate 1-decarboxylase